MRFSVETRTLHSAFHAVFVCLLTAGCAAGGEPTFREDSSVDSSRDGGGMCSDGIQNGNETGIDCGGADCPSCRPTCSDGIQNGIESDVDCGGLCMACPSCTDGLHNGDETGVDCGGPCAACPTSCADGIQNEGETGVDCGGPVCAACSSCTDGMQNGDETGIDCGGTLCAACPSCSDGILNGGEIGTDCGGPCMACTTCSDGLRNGTETGVDCGGTCLPCPTCTDGTHNGDEVGIDCGGSCPMSCASCGDSIMNGGETGVDCGGPCGPCTFLDVWRLTEGSTRWIRVVPNETDAPRSPVLAAFDVESQDRAYLLTASTYHIMTLSAPQRFIGSGSLASLFPELARNPTAAYQVPARGGERVTNVTLGTATHAYLYDFNLDSHTFVHSQTVSDNWAGTGVNAPTYADANAMWLSLEDDEMWTACADDSVYAGVLVADRVHVQSLGSCGGGFTEMPLARDFDPFGRTDVPRTSDVDAMFYHEGALWLFLH